ncbi:ornithine cyclodeaminase family protein [Mycobacterium sp. CVI_P3]|uniref:Ornithine cyclodeaminase family protein n=1 Tax=Mycobacterium pinniadriaticum TaxID=2994102 RepID=A0ABT3SKY0_9MYCO|nr:ornithine cyclodeaminase family protein [Mycobacterium pinniadriaticum]MCX2933752.1 ornithine cyclodeaminase family protein [Mycobacterium pinniadriaticum]MCX2940174.1 ornithine cyclodeaminase family protein [Mycobacterium pinniadriaticum]
MTLLLSDADVRVTADMPRLVDAVETVLREEHDGLITMPPRVNVASDGTVLRLMPAHLAGSNLMGYKSFHGSLAKGVRYLIVLMRADDGDILALVDAALLTGLRTGATSAVATRHLTHPGSADVAVIGSGLEAETNLAGVAAVRPVQRVRVFSPNPQRRAAFAGRAGASLGVEAVATATAQEAVTGADIVIVATNTGPHGPVAYRGAWIEPGQHIVSVGATSPFLRELDEECFDRLEHVVFDASPTQVFEESGDLIALTDASRSRLAGASVLSEVVAHGFDRGADAVTLFKSVGTAAQDLAAAKVVYDTAVQRGIGREIGVLADVKQF